jgi:hypothetical protein
VDTCPNKYKHGWTLAANIIAIAIMITLMTTSISISERSVNAQMMGDHVGESKINTSLTQAMATAEKSVGNDSFAVAAFGSEEGGYFAYRIILATPEMKFYYAKVDPGNGQILETQQVSQKELDKMHKEHSAMVVSNSGSGSFGVTGFPFIIPH